MKFKSDIEVQAGIKDYAGSSGTSGQVLSSDGATVSWIDAEIGVARDVQNTVKAGVAINKGQAVYVTGADGTNIIVGLASNTSEATSSKTLGLLNATVAANGFADVVQIGKLSGLNTIGANIGDPVWLGTNGNLIYGLANKPYAPAHLVYIGVVTRVNANNGEIFITVQNGFELKEIHDVDIITNVPVNGDILGYDGTLWVNKTIAEWLGYIPADDATVVHKAGTETITGTKTFLDNITYFSNNSSYNIELSNPDDAASILRIGASAGAGNITSDGGLGINVGGTISAIGISANGSTFFSNTITAPGFKTYSGTASQFLKANGTVDSTVYVPTTRTITINGVTQDLSTNRTWTVSGGVSGSGTTNKVPKFTAATVVGDSIITDNGTTISISGTGTGGNATLKVNTSTATTFVHSQENMAANLTTGQHNISVIGKEANTKNAGYIGYYWAGAASNSNFVTIGHWGNDDLLRVYGSGEVTATVNIQAPIFYDSNNTGYYGDFASTSNFNKLILNSENTFNAATPGLTSYGLIMMGGTSDYSNGITWTWGNTNSQAGVYVQSSGAYGTKMYFATTDSFATGSKTGMSMDHNGTVLVTRSYLQSDSSLRAPIFYDSNNTGYYADLASAGTSINIAGSINASTYNKPALLLNSSGTGSSGAAFGMQQVTAEGWTGIFVDFEPNTGWGLYHDNPSNYFLITAETTDGNIGSNVVPSRSSGNRTAYTKFQFQQTDGIGIAGGSWRAPIFYDYNNTGYYVDPASASNFSSVYANNWFRSYGNTGLYGQDYGVHFYPQNANAWSITGSGGTVELQFRSNYGTAVMGYVYADTSNNIGFLNNGGGWALRTDSSNNAYVYGTTLTVNTNGAGSSSIDMNDGDEGARSIHCNSNRIGFLNQSSSWGSYCTDNGDWVTDTISWAGASSRAPIFYDSNNTGYYLDQASTSNLNEVYSYSYRGNGNVGGTGSAAWFPNGFYSGNGSQCWLYGSLERAGYGTTGGGAAQYTILYDTNDTGYYVDPASSSNIRNITVSSLSNSTGLTVNHSGSSPSPAAKFNSAGGGTTYGAITATFDSCNYGTAIRIITGLWGASQSAMQFYSNTTSVGSISCTTSATAYNTSSDYRLKENVVPMESSISRLKELNPCRFNFINSPDKTVDGFIAHEVQEVIPEAITGEKDELDYDGSPKYQGIDQSKIVPLLTSALQEAILKIEQLENRLSTLENK